MVAIGTDLMASSSSDCKRSCRIELTAMARTFKEWIRFLVFWIDFGFHYQVLATVLCIALLPFRGARKATIATHKIIFSCYWPQLTVVNGTLDDFEKFEGVVASCHKGFFDFCIGGMYSSAFVGRMLAAICVPFNSVLTFLGSGMYLVIRRGKFQEDPNALVNKVKKFLEDYPRLLVFPEGHRFQQRGLLRLRTGFIRICYGLGVPVMVAPMEGSQNIINEKTLTIRRGMPLVLVHGGVVSPEDYDDWKPFYEEFKTRFERAYDEACRVYDELTA
ncbi:Acyltransferase [Carpediemonas membranifera]|uniref:Acyltransferase n=1 Tax=Carpediemonas membranifera TaxID=201153 RepID=A0A8J6AT78_9EUKA|nr:Acyltransferase [Carpediemonas membranifera]|eukprot:KAG9393946.1 Acyltransferase [Carpediemonas membranifera]